MTIALDIIWRNLPESGNDGASLGWGDAILSVNGAPVWFAAAEPQVTRISWSWIELLEFLASKWTYLLAEQTYPLGLTPRTPSTLRADAETRWVGQELFRSDLDDDEELFRFEGRHDLARGLKGIDLPSVLIVREGERAWVSTAERDHYVDFRSLVAALENIGNTIAAHIAPASTERAKNAVKGWGARSTPDTSSLIRAATAIPLEAFRSDTKYQSLQFWELEASNLADSELAAAARLLPGTAISKAEIDTVFEEIRKIPKVPTPKLDALTVELAPMLAEMAGEDPFRQGYAVALEVRNKLQLGDGRVSPGEIIRSFGVHLLRQRLSEGIDAVGCWGPRHGPAIVLNESGKRSSSVHGERATLAHEICHLLLDRERALPMAEVLGGKSPYQPERRSNAFAAELLFPRWQARTIYKNAKNLEAALVKASEQFDVSRSLAAGQFLNASQIGLTANEESKLRSIVKSDANGWDYA